jgi:hypothetical protein
MSFPTQLNIAVVTTLIGQIALLYVAPGIDLAAARAVAAALLADYNAQTNQELALAADIISFRRRALDALTRAADPELPLKTILRLNSSGIGLSREANKAQRQLDRLRRDRAAEAKDTPNQQQVATAAQPAPEDNTPGADPAPNAIQAPAIKPAALCGPASAQALHKRILTQRILDNAKRNQAAAQAYIPVSTTAQA